MTNIIVAFLVGLLAAPWPISAGEPARSIQRGEPFILFEFSVSESGGLSVDPIALIRGGTPVPLSVDFRRQDGRSEEEVAATYDAFAKKVYPQDARLTVVEAGSPKGTVEPKENFDQEVNRFECYHLSKEVMAGSIALRGSDRALAVNGTIRALAFNRRMANDQETAVLLKTGRRLYASYGVEASWLDRMVVEQAIAYEPRSQGDGFLFGSIDIATDFETGTRHNSLFVVLEGKASALRLTHHWYHDGFESEMAKQQLVDLIDLDGDSRPELITVRLYYEQWDFAIYRKRAGAWRMIYEGGGGGC